uniref:Uncharacterized protein n=1 Tax=Anguilla anguilla TaxID=7936 RepID=A0A0E9TSY7_ANGAN
MVLVFSVLHFDNSGVFLL